MLVLSHSLQITAITLKMDERFLTAVMESKLVLTEVMSVNAVRLCIFEPVEVHFYFFTQISLYSYLGLQLD